MASTTFYLGLYSLPTSLHTLIAVLWAFYSVWRLFSISGDCLSNVSDLVAAWWRVCGLSGRLSRQIASTVVLWPLRGLRGLPGDNYCADGCLWSTMATSSGQWQAGALASDVARSTQV